MKETQRPGSVPPASVFLDPTGRRKRWSRLLFRLTMAGFAAYIGLLAASLIADPRLVGLVPRPSSADLGRRLVYRPPTGPAAVARQNDRSTSAAVAVPDYAAALGGITVPAAARSRPGAAASVATSNPSAASGAPSATARPDTVTVTTTLRSSDWPLNTWAPGGHASAPAPPTSPTTSTRPSTAPTTTTTTSAAPGGPAPAPTTTTTTAPAPTPTTTTTGQDPDRHGPPGLLRKWASRSTR